MRLDKTYGLYRAEDILQWANKEFGANVALSASFGAPEGMVLLDMMHKINPDSRVFMLDTGRMHQATYDLVDAVRLKYCKQIEMVLPLNEEVEAMVEWKGHNLFYESQENRKFCCKIRKVEPLQRHLSTLDAYVTGIRREQNENRRGVAKIEFDDAMAGIVKINPLADWTAIEVADYIEQHDVPVNRLHAEGYPSVGCEPCTRAVLPGEDDRAGRWWWERDNTRECGIHLGEEDGSGI